MIKKCTCAILALFLALGTLSCAALDGGAASVGFAFSKAIAAADYDNAYDYLYEHSAGLSSKEAFIQRFQNIYNALQITDISLADPQVEEREDRFFLTYTLHLTSALLGELSYDYSADIIKTLHGYAVEYTPSLILPYLETGDAVRLQTQYGLRGEIFDRDRELLAQNSYAESVYLDITAVEDIHVTAAALSAAIDAENEIIVQKYENAVENSFDFEVIKAYPRHTFSAEERQALSEIPGVGVDDGSMTPIRYYPMQDSFAHAVGYLGSPSEEELAALADAGITEDSKIGKTGLEAAYEDILRPENGIKLFVEDAFGNEKQVLYEVPKKDGQDLQLSLSAKTQNQAYTLLSTYTTAGQSGAVIVMDTHTGALEALVSYPSFDPNYFSFPIESAFWEYLNSEDSETPLFFRATQAVYPPGSTFKPFSVIPALENGLIHPETVPSLTIQDNEWIPNVENWVYPSIKRAYPTLGDFNLLNAMKSSDNIFYAYTALLAGEEKFMAYMDRIGLKETLQFELPAATPNLLNQGTQMNIKILADMGYGMGELLISPLQLACMYTAFMNGGDMVNPTLVDAIHQSEGRAYTQIWEKEITHFQEDTMSAASISTVMEALGLVVQSGTAYPVRTEGVQMVGKTGTAQIGEDRSREINWIVLMGQDAGNEKLVMVMLDTDTDEGDAKFDIAKALIQPEGYTENIAE